MMAWWGNSLNESLSSIKDQVSTFTKVLTEDEDDPNYVDVSNLDPDQNSGALSYKKQIEELESRLQTSEIHNAAKYNALLEKYKKSEEEISSLKNRKSSQEWETVIGQPGTSPHSPSQSANIIVLQKRLTDEREAHQTELSQLREKYDAQIKQFVSEAEALRTRDVELSEKFDASKSNEVDEKIKESTLKFQEEIETLNEKLRQLTEECENISCLKNQKENDLQELDTQHQLAIEELLKQKKEMAEELEKLKETPTTQENIVDATKLLDESSTDDGSEKTPLDSLMDKNQLLMTEIDVLKENEPTKLPYSDVDELRVKEGIISQLQMQLEKANMDIEKLKTDKKLAEDSLIEINHKNNLIKGLQAEVNQLKNYHEILISDKDSIIYIKELDLEHMTEELNKANSKVKDLESRVSQLQMKEQPPPADKSQTTHIIEQLLQKLELQDHSDLYVCVSDMASEVARLRCERDELHITHEATLKEVEEIQANAQSLENEKEQLAAECEELRDQLEEHHTGTRSPSELSQSSLGALPTIEEEEDSELATPSVTEEEDESGEAKWKAKATKLSIQMRCLLDAKLSAERELRDIKQRNEQLLGEFHQKEYNSSNNIMTIDLTSSKAHEDELRSYVEHNDSSRTSAKPMPSSDTEAPTITDPEFDELRATLISKEDQLDGLKQDIEEIGEIFGLEKCNNRTVYITAKKEFNRLKDQVQDLTKQIENTSKDSEIYRQEMKTLRDELLESSKHKDNLTEECKCLREQKTQVEKELEQTHETLSATKEENIITSESLRKLQESVNERTQQLSIASDKETQLQAKVDSLEQSIIELNCQIDTLSNSLSDVKPLASEASTLQEEISNKNVHIDNLQKELSEFRIQLERITKSKNEDESSSNLEMQGSLQEALEKSRQLSTDKALLEKQVSKLEEELAEAKSEISNLTSQRDTLVATSTQKHQESLMYYQEIEKLSTLIKENEQKFESETKDISQILMQREESLNEAQSQNSSLNDQIQNLRNECQNLRKNIAGLRKERDQMVSSHSSLTQKLEESSKHMQSSGDKEKQLSQECARLRDHLISVEEIHTKEALQAAERENTLKQTIANLHEKISSHSNLYTSNNQKYATELGSLKEQCENAISERDDLRQKLHIAEEVSFQHQEALKRLQQVLHDFQKNQTRDIASAVDRERRKLEEERKTSDELRIQVSQMQTNLSVMEDKVKSHGSLENELHSKEDTIVALKSQVHAIQQAAKKSQDQVAKLQTSSDGKIDKHLLRNLVVGYLATPSDKQHEVMRIIAQVLDFSNEERHRTGIDQQPGSWMSSVANFLAPPPSNLRVASRVEVLDHSSLSQAFIRFLEDESTVQSNIKLPAVQMAEEVTKKAQKKAKAQMVVDSSKSVAKTDNVESSNARGNAFLDTANTPQLTPNTPLLVTPETTSPETLSEPKFLKNLLESPNPGT